MWSNTITTYQNKKKCQLLSIELYIGKLFCIYNKLTSTKTSNLYVFHLMKKNTNNKQLTLGFHFHISMQRNVLFCGDFNLNFLKKICMTAKRVSQ